MVEALLEVDAIVVKSIVSVEKATDAYKATLENRLFNALESSFNRRAKKAVKRSKRYILSQDIELLDGTDVTAVDRICRRAFRGWGREMKPIVRRVAAASYKEGQRVTVGRINGKVVGKPTAEAPIRKAAVQPGFSVVDKKAINAISQQQTVWIGRHYRQNLSRRVRGISSDIILKQGLKRRAAAVELEKALIAEFGLDPTKPFVRGPGVSIPAGWTGTSLQYFDGVAANTVTTARVSGSLRTMQANGITHYEIVNPNDGRTCSVCAFMNGKIFPVESGIQGLDNELSARNPSDVKSMHPWHKLDTLTSTTGLHPTRDTGAVSGPKTSALTRGGYERPTFHFKCRCTVDIATGDGIPLAPLPEVQNAGSRLASRASVGGATPAQMSKFETGVRTAIGRTHATSRDKIVYYRDPTDASIFLGNVDAARNPISGKIMTSPEITKSLEAIARTGKIQTWHEANSFQLFVHENYHGIGPTKVAGRGSKLVKYLRTNYGTALEEGATELSSVLEYREIASKAKLKISSKIRGEIAERVYRGAGKVSAFHSYKRETELVEKLLHRASGGTYGQALNPKGRKLLKGLLHEWQVEKRTINLGTEIARASGVKGAAGKQLASDIERVLRLELRPSVSSSTVKKITRKVDRLVKDALE